MYLSNIIMLFNVLNVHQDFPQCALKTASTAQIITKKEDTGKSHKESYRNSYSLILTEIIFSIYNFAEHLFMPPNKILEKSVSI